jgi:PAS domain S-box-containing protein
VASDPKGIYLSQQMETSPDRPAAQTLIAHKQHILELWEAKVREQVPAAKQTARPALVDSLPELLDRLAKALASSSPEQALASEEATLATDHGKERAQAKAYSLDEVIFEYQVLRQVLLGVVEGTQPLPAPTREMIFDFILLAVRNAASEFARLREAEKDKANKALKDVNEALDRRVRERVAALNVSEERFRRLVEAVKDYAIFTLDPKGYITSWNPGCVRMKGYAVDEAVGQHFSMLYPAEGNRRDEPMGHLRSAAIEGRFRGEGVRVRKNRDHFLADVSITPMYEDGVLVGFAKVVQDLTERKLLMQERDLSREDADKLRQEAEFREQFVASLSHDLRSPLAAAKASADLILRSPDKTEKVVEWGQRIVQSIDRTDAMITDLLDATRIQAGRPPALQFEPCDLAAIAAQLCEELSSTHGIPITVEVDGDASGLWNAEALRRVLDNLLSNALKYGEPGQPVKVRIRRADGRVLLAVHNSGTIIPVEEQEKLFVPFHRTEGAQATGQKGWGIGLALVKSLVEAHRGIVKVESYPKEGTTFTVDLPVDASAKA